MIRIDRSRVPMPSILGPDPNAPGPTETQKAAAFYEMPLEKRMERHYPFKVYRDGSVREALEKLFYGKCAYCETKLSPKYPAEVEHFRPKNGVVGEVGEHYPDLYWWLANEWTNLYPVCLDCSRPRAQEIYTKGSTVVRSGKGSRFPLKEGSLRAHTPEDVPREEPLLLDPCTGDPEKHLVFVRDGLVVSETLEGQTTIAVLGLNRASLVEARGKTAEQVEFQIETVRLLLGREDPSQGPQDPNEDAPLQRELGKLVQLTEPDQEYTALKRQLVRTALAEIRGPEPETQVACPPAPVACPPAPMIACPPAPQIAWKRVVDKLPEPELKDLFEGKKAPAAPISREDQVRAQESYRQYQQSLEAYSLEERGGEREYFSQRRLIERIEIQNLKAFNDLDLDLTTSKGGGTPWTMLLGENATGKSTVLKAVALALIGQRYFTKLASRLGIHPVDYVRRGQDSGYVKVHISGFSGPFVLTFYPDSVEFQGSLGETARVTFSAEGPAGAEGKDWQAKVFVLGYGATRLLPRRAESREDERGYARVDNLFDPYTPLVNATPWLLSLSEERFHFTRLALKRLLALQEEADIYPRDGRVWIQAHGTEVPLEYLSDGYQAMVALTTDVLEIVFTRWPEPAFAEGVVLLDEVGAHLHPTWKMRVVDSLRDFLPGMQFLATTHEPLCLRGLFDGEVVLMRRDASHRVWAITDLPSIAGLRVDQLLTSQHFGLKSTIDPIFAKLLDDYYELLLLKKRTPKQEEDLAEYKKTLRALGQMGTTRREQMMLEAIDEYLAREVTELDPKARLREAHATKRTLAQILSELDE